MPRVFETTVDGANYDVVWSDTPHGPEIDDVLYHNTEKHAPIDSATFRKLQDKLALDIVARALKL